MSGKLTIFIFFIFTIGQLQSQTTDLSIVAKAENSSGTEVSQVQIYEDFQYSVTIINSGNAVANASFEITMDTDLQNLSLGNINSQNNSGGASNVSDLNLNEAVLTGTVANLPNDSSVELIIQVTAPTTIGGIAINAIITAPSEVTDTNISNNQSLISIDVIDVAIDFSVTHTQISPSPGTPISAWNSLVTYRFTITNNSAIDFELSRFFGNLNLMSNANYGKPNAQLVSLACVGTTGGTTCQDLSNIPTGTTFLVGDNSEPFSFDNTHVYTAGGSATYELVYRYLEPTCGIELAPISVSSVIEIELDHANLSPNTSNPVTTNLLEGELCQFTDICIDTIQINPDPLTQVGWNEEVTFETTLCNNGPLDATTLFFLKNQSSIFWDILSVTCTQTTGSLSCEDVPINIESLSWTSDAFVMPADASITITTVVVFTEPNCAVNANALLAQIRSGANILDDDIYDSFLENNAQNDFVKLPGAEVCPSSDLSVTKFQVDPELPIGESAENPAQNGTVTYEITATNNSDLDTVITLSDFTISSEDISYIGTLLSVECVSTTGDAECFTIENSNSGIPLDGIPENGVPDTFWKITAADNWELPANSSVTFLTSVNWETDCSVESAPVSNAVRIAHATATPDNNLSNNYAEVVTFFAPCVDLVVQTFPEFTQVNVNQTFDWIIDITNSENSSNAINIAVKDTLNEVFTVAGTPTCTVTDGNATCITNLVINDNIVTGTIDNMEAGSTIRIRIPVTAPSFGGAYNNTAFALADEADRFEISPETNTSISNVQVIAPLLSKSYSPDVIIAGEESTLTFKITNLPSQPAQSNIAFTDVFPAEISLVSSPFWENDNGCTASFIGNAGDHFAGVSNLTFPSGVVSCTFSVVVTSSTPGVYLNDNANFEAQNSIDTSQTNATLTVLEDSSNVDIEILKTVSPQEATIGAQVNFQITVTNLGTTEATGIEILDDFPNGMVFISESVSEGIFDTTTNIWSIGTLASGQSETLTITAQITSSQQLRNVALLNAVNEPDRDSSNNMDDAEVSVGFCLFIPEGFSPNQDGSNDVFFIECLEEYPNNRIQIFNRLGVQVYESRNYQNDWDGRPNMGFPNTSNLLPVGTYFYILDLNTGEKPILGWVYLNY